MAIFSGGELFALSCRLFWFPPIIARPIRISSGLQTSGIDFGEGDRARASAEAFLSWQLHPACDFEHPSEIAAFSPHQPGVRDVLRRITR